MEDKPKKPSRRKPTEKQLAALRPAPPWKKGQSGNPKGRPKGSRNRDTILREMLALTLKKKGADGNMADVEHPLDPSRKSITVEEGINAALVNRALKGEIRAIQEIQDTLYGKIKETKVLENPDGSALKMTAGLNAEQAGQVYLAMIADLKKGKQK